MKKFSFPKLLLLLNLLAVGLLVGVIQVQSYRMDVISRNNILYNVEKSYFSGCMNEAKDRTDEMTKWSCHLFSQNYRRDFQNAVGIEPVARSPFYDKIIDVLAL